MAYKKKTYSAKEYEEKNSPEKDKETSKEKETRKAIELNLWLMQLPPINLDDSEQVKNRAMMYFKKCEEVAMKPGLEALCLSLHVNKETFKTWRDGTRRKGQEHQNVANTIFQFIKSLREGELLEGTINTINGIFLTTNQDMGYMQKQVITTEQAPSILDTASREELEKRYMSELPNVIDAEIVPAKQIKEKEKKND